MKMKKRNSHAKNQAVLKGDLHLNGKLNLKLNMMQDEMRNKLRLRHISVLTPMAEKENT